MASHRSTQSVDVQALQPPSLSSGRRMSLSIPPSPSQVSGRPPSPLRNGFIPDTSTRIPHDVDDDDDRSDWRMRSPSPASSVTQFASNLAKTVGTLINPRPPGWMPSDAELEAEAERERDQSRREAERILTREAMERKLLEDRVLEVMETSRSLPPPPSRTQTMSTDPPSPSPSQKEGLSWWTAAKNRLTPSKDKDLTPAQQIIHETKSREKEKKNDTRTLIACRPLRDVQFLLPPTSPTPRYAMAPNLTPSPRRSADTIGSSPSGKDPLPVYAQFDDNGTLDVHVTLLTIAKRFEKLEKWTVGHVRALEERMTDVERWLLERETQKEQDNGQDSGMVSELREEMNELQSRMGELGREMARMVGAPVKLASGPSRQPAEFSSGHQAAKSHAAEHVGENDAGYGSDDNPFAASPNRDRHYLPPSARQSTSPPLASSSKVSSATRLPYPSGDYATPPATTIIPQGPVRSTSPESLTIAGLPAGAGLGLGLSSASSSYSSASFSSASSISPGLPAATSPSTQPKSPSPAAARPLPVARMSSASPSPTPKSRKRYTVALGGPIVAPEDFDESGEETIGKKSSAAAIKSLQTPTKATSYSTNTSPASSPPDRRIRAQSSYGFSSLQTPPAATTQPLNPSRMKSRSTDRLFAAAAAQENGRFVDPLVLRRQQEVKKSVGVPIASPVAKGKGKVPIGDLVKFFDGDRKT
ncbi:hypothetical protein C8J56DRAFT_1157944 [Mycena floridula]|nr:hypothetical protein C8J56DRAFT_1157944 [Mycena floridula]